MSKLLAFLQSNFLGVSILIAAVLISGALLLNNPEIINRSPQTSGYPPVKTSAPDVGDLPVLGNANAKVTLVEFGDYQCPFCGRFFKETEPKIISEYVNTGKARFAWRDLAFLGQESVWAAQAARCAGDQGKYWEYHNILFERQKGENEGAFSKENLKKFASDLKLDRGKFDSCLDSEKYRPNVEADTKKAADLGVNATPTVFVNGQVLRGALPFETFKEAIDKELEK